MRHHLKLIFLAMFLLVGAKFNSFASVSSDVFTLKLNVPTTREFKSGERHLFSVEAQNGEALEVIADKKAVDIGLTVFSPDNEKVVASNAPGGFAGHETVFFIAEKSGTYQIEITSRRPGNFTGGYTINLINQRFANEIDLERAATMKNFVESGLNVSEFAPKEFFAEEQKLLKAIADAAFKRDEAVKAKNTDAQKEAETNLQKIFDDYQILQEATRKQNPRFSAISQPKDFSFKDAQNLLDANTAFLEFSLGEKQSYGWLISKTAVKFAKLPARSLLNQTAREFYAALTDRATKSESVAVEKSRQLSRLILQPFAAELLNLNRLVVIADGSLQLVPFSALTLPLNKSDEPLAATLEIVNAPSFSSLIFMKESRTNRRNSSAERLAIFADPIFQADDERFGNSGKLRRTVLPNSTEESAKLAQTLRDFGVERLARLPFSGIEAREIAGFAPKQTILALGANASRQKFLRGDYNSYQILHFATHGFLNQQNPDLSGLVLSLYDEKRQAQNGFLRVIDLYALRLNADLVVLSACQTGLGKEVDGEGIIGLTRGFMFAGASSVVSSLWKVEDAATAELMKRFYRAMLAENQSPSAALRTAQNELRRIPRWHNPTNWAGFTLSGDWR